MHSILICWKLCTVSGAYLDYHHCLYAPCSIGYFLMMNHCYLYAHPNPSLTIQLVAHLCIPFVIAPNLNFYHIYRAHTSTMNCMVCQRDEMLDSWSSFYSKRDVALLLIQHLSMNVAVHHVVLNADLWVDSLQKKIFTSIKSNTKLIYVCSYSVHPFNWIIEYRKLHTKTNTTANGIE